MRRWDYHINIGDIWENDDLTFEERRDQLVARVKASRAYVQAVAAVNMLSQEWDIHEEFLDNVEQLAIAQDPDEFDEFWSDIYDYCDYRRIWIDLWKSGADS